jgi:endonuclease/exonuclease/phosphatase family metal-dependent hydrolase
MFLSFLKCCRKGVIPGVVLAIFLAPLARGQILMGAGTYAQNFDALTNSGNPNWTNNVTLPGWYISKTASPNTVTNYNLGTGSSSTGAFYSFGGSGSGERALGSLASGTPGNFAYGVRFTNDTGSAQSNITVSCTGEEWRVANVSAQKLAFAYQVGSSLTNSDAASNQTWTAFSALDFSSPNTNLNGNARALEGNDPTNRTIFTNIVLTGVAVQPGQEIFFRWFDADDSGFDDGLAIDALTVSFQAANNSPPPDANSPAITAQPQSQAAGEGGFAIFSASATGNPAPNFQWQLNETNLPGATSSMLALNNVAANQAGNYSVIVTNSAGATNSRSAALIVMPVSFDATNGAIRILQYNVEGNGATDWTTNAAQVQAIGRELMYLNPDIITFNEIPTTNGLPQMTNWVKAFLPGYFLATNSFGDTFIQNVIASRFPITRSASHLHTANLNRFGYTNNSSQNADNFTHDLFEAQIAVPNWPLPLHVFVAHLKSTTGSTPADRQDDANKRAAEAAAVSNYFAAVFLTGTNATHPYVLDGDMNEDAFFPESNHYTSGHPIQRLTSPPTGLQMTIPVNFITHTDLTESIQGTLDTRFDYILPCPLLFSNIAASEVFRTDLLAIFPPNLNSNDDKIASDHLPVLMVFKNPFDTPFRLLSVARTNQNVTLKWESQNNRVFNIEASSNLTVWTPFATNITTTTNPAFTFTTNATGSPEFFRIYRVP